MRPRRRTVAAGVALAGLAASPAGAQPEAAMANWGGYPMSAALSQPVFTNPGATVPVAPPPFQAHLGLNAQESWTDNVYLVGAGAGVELEGKKNIDTVTALTPTVLLSAVSRRIDFTADYAPTIDRYRQNTNLDGVNQNGITAATVELLEKELYFDARASSSVQAVNPSAASAVSTRTLSTNSNQSKLYQAGPRWQEELVEDIVLQATASRGETWNHASGNALGGALPNQPDLTNVTNDQGRIEIRQLAVGTPLQWILSGESSDSKQGGTGLGDVVEQFASELRVDDDWSVLATGGEEHLRGSGLSPSLSGPFFNAGLHWRPSPNLEARATAGHRAGAADLNGLIDWQIGPRTVFRLTQSVRVTDDQQRLFSSLTNLQKDENGNFVDPFSGLPATSLNTSYQLTNSVYRLESTSVALSHSDLTDSLSLIGELDQRTTLGTAALAGQPTAVADLGTRDSSALVSFRWSHRLTKSAGLSLSLGDTETLSTAAGQTRSKTYSILTEWSYSLSSSAQLKLSYRLNETLQPGSSTSSLQNNIFGRVKEDFATIGVNKSF